MEYFKAIDELNSLITSKIDFKQFILFINKKYKDIIKISLNTNMEVIITSYFPDDNYIAILVNKDIFNFKEEYI